MAPEEIKDQGGVGKALDQAGPKVKEGISELNYPGLIPYAYLRQARNLENRFFTKGVNRVRLYKSPVARIASAWVG
jgi:hypothetical protein